MSGTSWLQFAALIAVLVCRAMAGATWPRSTTGQKAPASIVWADRARDLPGMPSRSRQRAAVEHLCPVRACVQCYVLPCCWRRIARFRACCRSIRRAKPAVTDHVAFNAAVNRGNTNWQSYSGEATMSHFTQMTGLAVQNFVSASAGMCAGGP